MKNMVRKINAIYILMMAAVALGGCRKEMPSGNTDSGNYSKILLRTADMAGNGAADSESDINSVVGFRFTDGLLKEKYADISMDAEGGSEIYFSERKGTLYILVNADEIMDMDSFVEDVTTESEFLKLSANVLQMTSGGLTMTASVSLEGTKYEIPLKLKRSVARLDLKSMYEGVSVRKVTVRNIAESTYVNDVPGVPSGKTEDLVWDFSSGALSLEQQTLSYVGSQSDGPYQVEVELSVNGAWRRQQTVINSIVRNTVYTVNVFGNGSSAEVEVSEGDWENGDGVSSGLVQKGVIDVESSILSEGSRVSAGLDTLFLSYLGSDVVLAVKAQPGSTVQVKGSVDGVEIHRQETRTMSTVATFEISGIHRFPGKLNEYIYLDILSDQTGIGRVVVVAEANPVLLSGKIKLDDNGKCDFGRYIDGELGVLTLPEGRTIRLDFPEGEKQWARVVQLTDNSYRIDGGWKPNDPEADGRKQTVDIIISDADGGGHPETYTLARRNWGLPVVNVNGTWWCKYNLRGNVKNFEDQITVADDPVGDGSISEYLQTCTDEEFLKMAGEQYQAGNQQGLAMKLEGSAFIYEGFNPANKEDFGSLDPEMMAPDGYRIPGYQEYRFFTWNENANMGYGSNAFNNMLGQRLTYKITEREVSKDGVSYGVMQVYDFDYDGTHWVLLGLGHQYNATQIAASSIIFATHGAPGRSWMMEGYKKSEGRGNWYKYTSHNAIKTRMIRCIKTPVDYIYE